MKNVILIALSLVIMGCSSTPEPFETGVRTMAPYGYTDMIERESK